MGDWCNEKACTEFGERLNICRVYETGISSSSTVAVQDIVLHHYLLAALSMFSSANHRRSHKPDEVKGVYTTEGTDRKYMQPSREDAVCSKWERHISKWLYGGNSVCDMAVTKGPWDKDGMKNLEYVWVLGVSRFKKCLIDSAYRKGNCKANMDLNGAYVGYTIEWKWHEFKRCQLLHFFSSSKCIKPLTTL